MKKSTYMDRALRAADPRFARVLGKLGYHRSDLAAAVQAHEEEDALSELRAEYQDVVGKKAYHAWDADTLRAKIAEAKNAGEE